MQIQYTLSLLFSVDSDYDAVSQLLTFDASTSRDCFDTSTVEDDPLEDDETYTLTLTSPVDRPGLTLNPPQTTVTIIDEDGE